MMTLSQPSSEVAVYSVRLPGFRAELSLLASQHCFRGLSSASRSAHGHSQLNSGVVPASAFCGICRFQGCDCQTTCSDCGPFDVFTCCEKRCVNCPGIIGDAGFAKEVLL